MLRRGRPEETLRLRLADLQLAPITRSATRGDLPIELTTREFELLDYLLRGKEQ